MEHYSQNFEELFGHYTKSPKNAVPETYDAELKLLEDFLRPLPERTLEKPAIKLPAMTATGTEVWAQFRWDSKTVREVQALAMRTKEVSWEPVKTR